MDLEFASRSNILFPQLDSWTFSWFAEQLFTEVLLLLSFIHSLLLMMDHAACGPDSVSSSGGGL